MPDKVQKFNVLCVTKRSLDDRNIAWHLPITGIAEVFTSCEEEMGVRIFKTMVRFRGIESPFRHVRSGLSGTAVTIGVERANGPFGIWELYTDTPTEGNTREEVRRCAESEIRRNARYRQ